MPKVRIRELDYTGNIVASALVNTVYIPGFASQDVEPVLCEHVSDLTKIAGLLSTSSLAYRVAYHLLNAYKMPVLYQGFGKDDDGSQKCPNDNTWADIADKARWDIRFISAGDFIDNPNDEGDAGWDINAQMVKCAAKRGDCVALLDHAKDPGNSVAAVRTWFERFKDDSTVKGEFGAAFTPWFLTKDPDFLKDASSTEKESGYALPASCGYLFAYARATRNCTEWEAMAGSFRGIISELYEPLRRYSNAECEMLQARGATREVDLVRDDEVSTTPGEDNFGVAINPIAYVRPFGYLVWGDRTTLNNTNPDGVLKATAFLNVRNLVSSVKKALYDAARKYTFELNTATLWAKFKNEVTPLLDSMQTGNGIVGYRFKQLPTTQKARIVANLTIVPIEPVEDFDLLVELADSLTVSE